MSALDDLIASKSKSTGGSALDSLIASKTPQQRSWGQFGSNAADNASRVASDLYTAFSERPVETVKGIGKTFAGLAQGLVPGDQEWERDYAVPLVKHVGKDFGFYRKDDGSIGWDKEKLAQNIYERPVDLALDASMFTGPATGMPGRIGAAARVVDPISLTARGVSTVAKTPAKVAKYITGETSGLGPQAISEAYRSGRAGGVQGEAFRQGMRGDLDPDAPVDAARGAVDALKADRKAEYLQGREKWASDKRLAWDPIEAAFEAASGIKSFRGKDLKPSVAAARDKVRGALDEWKKDPAAWTVEGFDALKQRLQDLQQSLNPMTEGAARTMIGNVTSAIKRQIKKAEPEYAKTMAAYERASHAVTEVQKSLTGTSKTSYDTSLRKLQSILRNNAFTNYAARAKLADLISKKAPELMPMLSGMAANTWTPRGLPGKLIGGLGVGAAGYGAVPGTNAVTGALAFEPTALATLAAAGAVASPRVVGEAAHGLGRVRGAFDRAPGTRAAAKTSLALSAPQASIAHASQVLSQPILDDVRKSPKTSYLFNDWLKARYNGEGIEEVTQMLAAAIVEKYKIKDPAVYDRIIKELNETRGP